MKPVRPAVPTLYMFKDVAAQRTSQLKRKSCTCLLLQVHKHRRKFGQPIFFAGLNPAVTVAFAVR